MSITTNTVLQTVVRYQMWDQTLLNVLHWRPQTTGTSTDDYTWTKACIDKFVADIGVGGTMLKDIRTCISSDCSIVDITGQIVEPNRVAFYRAPVSVAGSRGLNQFPNVDTVVTKRTQLSGRRFVGAIHMPPGAQDDYVNGLLTAGFKTVVDGASTWLYTDYTIPANGAVLRPVIFHGSGASPFFTDVFQREVQQTARVMTRRTVGRGI